MRFEFANSSCLSFSLSVYGRYFFFNSEILIQWKNELSLSVIRTTIALREKWTPNSSCIHETKYSILKVTWSILTFDDGFWLISQWFIVGETSSPFPRHNQWISDFFLLVWNNVIFSNQNSQLSPFEELYRFVCIVHVFCIYFFGACGLFIVVRYFSNNYGFILFLLSLNCVQHGQAQVGGVNTRTSIVLASGKSMKSTNCRTIVKIICEWKSEGQRNSYAKHNETHRTSAHRMNISKWLYTHNWSALCSTHAWDFFWIGFEFRSMYYMNEITTQHVQLADACSRFQLTVDEMRGRPHSDAANK